jgi:anaerobic glycerol-3-phosphate dehydrogenase
MSLSNVNWNGKSNNASNVPQQQITINVPVVPLSGAVAGGFFTLQVNSGVGVTITSAPKSEADIAKERADAFDRAMGIVG